MFYEIWGYAPIFCCFLPKQFALGGKVLRSALFPNFGVSPQKT